MTGQENRLPDDRDSEEVATRLDEVIDEFEREHPELLQLLAQGTALTPPGNSALPS